MLIHKEYGHNNYDFARSDLIIFNPETVSEIVDPLNLKKGFTKNDYLQPAYIFEFGTEKSAKSDANFLNT
ncbi:MAG TPA: hypothetical protein PLF21_07885 [Exilispira sp.]|nr:hypothetical protein [Exilispira sp.]